MHSETVIRTKPIMLTRIKHLFQLRLALPTILLIIGLFLFLSCIFDWFGIKGSNGWLFNLLEKAGDLILISSVISFLIDSAEYLGIFKRELDFGISHVNYCKFCKTFQLTTINEERKFNFSPIRKIS